jgi:hypothetical protein
MERRSIQQHGTVYAAPSRAQLYAPPSPSCTVLQKPRRSITSSAMGSMASVRKSEWEGSWSVTLQAQCGKWRRTVRPVEESDILLHRSRVRSDIHNDPVPLVLRHLHRPIVPVRYPRSRSTVIHSRYDREGRHRGEDEFGEGRAGCGGGAGAKGGGKTVRDFGESFEVAGGCIAVPASLMDTLRGRKEKGGRRTVRRRNGRRV